jgi:hypothetical protein
MFSYKVFDQAGAVLLAIADVSIMGKTLAEGDIQFLVSKDFYSDKTCDEKAMKTLIKSATIINAVGKEIVSLLLDEKLVDKNTILYINGVPHVQIISI